MRQEGMPWGKILEIRYLCMGVRYVRGSRGHGIMIRKRTAEKALSADALARGHRFDVFIAFDGGIPMDIVLLEIPEARRIMYPYMDKDEILDSIIRSISDEDPEYLLSKGHKLDPDAYADWVERNATAVCIRNKDPDAILSAIRKGSAMEVTTADGHCHMVTPESYRKALRETRFIPRLSSCQKVQFVA